MSPGDGLRTSAVGASCSTYTSKRPLCCTFPGWSAAAAAEDEAARELSLASPMAASACTGVCSRCQGKGAGGQSKCAQDAQGTIERHTFRSSMSKFQLLTPRTYLRAATRMS